MAIPGFVGTYYITRAVLLNGSGQRLANVGNTSYERASEQQA